MARDVVDDRLIGALHIRALTRSGLLHDVAREHLVVQAGTIAALMDGHYDGDVRVGDLLARADLGIGTIQHLDGELVILDGEAWVAHADGTVEAVAPETKTPFVVACRFSSGGSRHVERTVVVRGALHRARRARATRRARGGGARRRSVPRPPPPQRARATPSVPAVARGRRPPDRMDGRRGRGHGRGLPLPRRQLRDRGPRVPPPLPERRPRPRRPRARAHARGRRPARRRRARAARRGARRHRARRSRCARQRDPRRRRRPRRASRRCRARCPRDRPSSPTGSALAGRPRAASRRARAVGRPSRSVPHRRPSGSRGARGS